MSVRRKGAGSSPGFGRRLSEPWASLVALAASRLEAGDHARARDAFAELGGLKPDLCEAWAGASVAAHLQGDRQAARTFRNMLEASCPPRDLLGWVSAMIDGTWV